MARQMNGSQVVDTDGKMLRKLRHEMHGEDSAELMAKVLSDLSGYKVHREHISAYENSHRPIPDKILEAAAKHFEKSLAIFPEYSAKHITPEEVAHPLVAWARLASQDMSMNDALEFIGKVEGINGSPLTPEVLELQARGIRGVQVTRLNGRDFEPKRNRKKRSAA